MIDQGKFKNKVINFNPAKTLKNISGVIKPLAKLQKTEFQSCFVDVKSIINSPLYSFEHKFMVMESKIRNVVSGDEPRMNQVIFSLLKMSLMYSKRGKIRLYMGYCDMTQKIYISIVSQQGQSQPVNSPKSVSSE